MDFLQEQKVLHFLNTLSGHSDDQLLTLPWGRDLAGLRSYLKRSGVRPSLGSLGM